MDMEIALSILGVTESSLSIVEKQKLDEDGFLLLHNILSPETTIAMRNRIEELAIQENLAHGMGTRQEAGTSRLSNLINKDPMFQICYTHPRVLATVNHILKGDFKLSSLNSRASLSGEGLQPLHVDWGEAVPADEYEVCNSVWLLDDFTEFNGATRVIPGTHKSGEIPSRVLNDVKAPHPNQVLTIAPAGTVVVFNSHLWHGGTLNRSQKARHALHSYFCRRYQPQQTNQKRYLSPKTISQLTDAEKFILDI